MSSCKTEFTVPVLFVLQVSENAYAAVCSYELEIHIFMQTPGQVLQPVLSSLLWQCTNYTPARQWLPCLGRSMNGLNDTDVIPAQSGLSLQDRHYFFTHTNYRFIVQHLRCQNYSLPYGEQFFVSSGYGLLSAVGDELLSIGQLKL